MPIYSKEQKQTLVDLINEANPDLNWSPVTLDNLRLATPFVRTPADGEIADTSLEVYPIDSSPFIGKQIVHYRRIDLEKLFRNRIVNFDYLLKDPNGAGAARVYPTDLANYLKERFGVLIQADDLNFSSIWATGPGGVWVGVQSSSYCYKGRFRVSYDTNGGLPYRVTDLIAQQNLNVRWWDRLHGGEEDTRPLLTLCNYGYDYGDLIANINRLSNGGVISENTLDVQTMLRRLNQLCNLNLTITKDHTETNGLAGLTFTKHTLPDPMVPEADSDRFGYVAKISSSEEGDSWFGGSLLFHYNIAKLTAEKTTYMDYVSSPKFYLSAPGVPVGTTLTWRMEEVDGRTPTQSGSFVLEQKVHTIEIPEALYPPDEMGYNIKFTVYRSNQPLATIQDIRVVPSLVVTPSDTRPRYDEPVTFEESFSLFDDSEIFWAVEVVDGSLTQKPSGSFTLDDLTQATTVTIPSTTARVLNTTWRLVYRQGSADGKILTVSPLISMDDVVGSITRTSSGSLTLPLYVKRVTVTLSGAGGGGGGGRKYQTDIRGGKGGNGAKRVMNFTLKENRSLSLKYTIGTGGVGGRFRADSSSPGPDSDYFGGDGGDSTVTIDAVTYTSEGGGGGKVAGYTSPNGTNGSPAGGAAGGSGGMSRRLSSGGTTVDPANSGDRGYITIDYRGW